MDTPDPGAIQTAYHEDGLVSAVTRTVIELDDEAFDEDGYYGVSERDILQVATAVLDIDRETVARALRRAAHPLGTGSIERMEFEELDERRYRDESAPEMGLPPKFADEGQPPPLEELDKPVREDPDEILKDRPGRTDPDFPGIMSGESIRMRDENGRDWREPRSLY